MPNNSDKFSGATNNAPGHNISSPFSRRLATLARKRKKRALAIHSSQKEKAPVLAGYDPELLFVECVRCGAPVLWEEGKATSILEEAGIDPLELDASCILLTDGCPACGSRSEYSVRIFRVTPQGAIGLIPPHGHA